MPGSRGTQNMQKVSRRHFLYLEGVCHEIFDPHFFICQCHLDPDKQVKIFSKLVSIFKILRNSAVCFHEDIESNLKNILICLSGVQMGSIHEEIKHKCQKSCDTHSLIYIFCYLG